jgi:hypothetical protein
LTSSYVKFAGKEFRSLGVNRVALIKVDPGGQSKHQADNAAEMRHAVGGATASRAAFWNCVGKVIETFFARHAAVCANELTAP